MGLMSEYSKAIRKLQGRAKRINFFSLEDKPSQDVFIFERAVIRIYPT